jgi:hypothetical protein
MSKSCLGGMTDYSHQSFQDILDDIKDEKEQTIFFRNQILKNIDTLETNFYWQNNVPFDFKSIVTYAIRHYDTTIIELNDIYKDLNIEVKEHHIKRLERIGTVAFEINVNIGRTWHNQYNSKDYGNKNFRIVESIYIDTRNTVVNLLDMSNIAARLNDFIGKVNPNIKKNNPWFSGSFYIVMAIIIFTGLAVLSNYVHWVLFPIIIIGGILIIFSVGTLQLKNDDRITDKSFRTLVIEICKRLPLIKNMLKKT